MHAKHAATSVSIFFGSISSFAGSNTKKIRENLKEIGKIFVFEANKKDETFFKIC